MKLSPQIKISLLTSTTVIIITLIVIFLLIPFQSKIKDLNQEIYDARVNFEFISQARQDVAYLDRALKEIQDKQAQLSPTIFSRNDTLKLITSLETIAQNHNLNDQKLNLSNPAALDSGMQVSTLMIDFTTSYRTLVNWLKEVEKRPFYLIINSIDLRSIANSSNNPSPEEISSSGNPISVAISAKVYWQ